MPIFRKVRPYITAYDFQQSCTSRHARREVQDSKPDHVSDSAYEVLKPICGYIRPCAPEDGHNGARIMLS